MSSFIGRKEELEILGSLLRKKTATLGVVRGRRRIGKSRLIEEFARQNSFDAVYFFSGIVPTNESSAQSQRDEFAVQLGLALKVPGIKALDWNTLFFLLADRIKQGRILVLFDEISWMGSKDSDFLGKFKNAWDLYFKRNNKLIFILCGSISTWIEKNILSSTGFVGRVSLDLTIKELPLHDCNKFWGRHAKQVSAYEKLKVLSVTGGVPLYLEQIDSGLSAEENIKRICFLPHGMLFDEFEKLFSDLFSKRSEKYKKIVHYLSDHSADQQEICQHLKIKQSGDIGDYLNDLIEAGFIAQDNTWRIRDGLVSRIRRYRLCDNYSRFYLKYVYPNKARIENKQFMSASISNLPGWSAIMGLQFENLVLNNKRALWKLLKVPAEEIICDNPYFQRKTQQHSGCQIDYLIQAKFNTLYICEIKFSKNEIKPDIISSIQNKITSLAIPKRFSYRPVLIHVNDVKDEVLDSDFFSEIIDFSKLLEIDS